MVENKRKGKRLIKFWVTEDEDRVLQNPEQMDDRGIRVCFAVIKDGGDMVL